MRTPERVIVAVANGPGFLNALCVTLTHGMSPLLVHAKTPPAELRRLALRFGVRWIITDGWSTTESAATGLDAQRLVGDDTGEFLAIRVDDRDPAFNTAYPDLAAVPLHPTSGTTGLPKIAIRPGTAAAVRPKPQHYPSIRSASHPSDVILMLATPMSHAYAFGMGVMVPLLSGTRDSGHEPPASAPRQFDAS